MDSKMSQPQPVKAPDAATTQFWNGPDPVSPMVVFPRAGALDSVQSAKKTQLLFGEVAAVSTVPTHLSAADSAVASGVIPDAAEGSPSSEEASMMVSESVLPKTLLETAALSADTPSTTRLGFSTSAAAPAVKAAAIADADAMEQRWQDHPTVLPPGVNQRSARLGSIAPQPEALPDAAGHITLPPLPSSPAAPREVDDASRTLLWEGSASAAAESASSAGPASSGKADSPLVTSEQRESTLEHFFHGAVVTQMETTEPVVLISPDASRRRWSRPLIRGGAGIAALGGIIALALGIRTMLTAPSSEPVVPAFRKSSATTKKTSVVVTPLSAAAPGKLQALEEKVNQLSEKVADVEALTHKQAQDKGKRIADLHGAGNRTKVRRAQRAAVLFQAKASPKPAQPITASPRAAQKKAPAKASSGKRAKAQPPASLKKSKKKKPAGTAARKLRLRYNKKDNMVEVWLPANQAAPTVSIKHYQGPTNPAQQPSAE